MPPTENQEPEDGDQARLAERLRLLEERYERLFLESRGLWGASSITLEWLQTLTKQGMEHRQQLEQLRADLEGSPAQGPHNVRLLDHERPFDAQVVALAQDFQQVHQELVNLLAQRQQKQHVPLANEQRSVSLRTASHRMVLGVAGVTLYHFDPLDPEKEPRDEELLLLSPEEAIQMARLIQVHALELEVRERELERQYEWVSQALVRAFPVVWRRFVEGDRTHIQQPSRFDQLLRHTLTQLVLDRDGPVGQWYASTFADPFSFQQHQALFWRFFRRTHYERLQAECLRQGQADLPGEEEQA
jgi:hypothetical protein